MPGLGGIQTVDVRAMCDLATEWEKQVRAQPQFSGNAVQVKCIEPAPFALGADNVELLINTCSGNRWRFDGG